MVPARPRRSSRSFSRRAPPPPGNRPRFHFCSALPPRKELHNCGGTTPRAVPGAGTTPLSSLCHAQGGHQPTARGHPQAVSQVLQGQSQRGSRARKPGIFPSSACNTGRSCKSQSICSPLPFLLFQGALDEKEKGLQHLMIHRGSSAFPGFPSAFEGPTATKRQGRARNYPSG